MEKLNWGLIGCGDISERRVAPAMNDLEICDLVAINRLRDELAPNFAERFNVPTWYFNWQDLVKDENIDAVYVSTPVYLHAEQTIAAAENGKHILCEKPMAMSVAECDKMIDACKANNVKLGIAYYRHFYSSLNRIKEIIANDEIGKVVHANINAFGWFDRASGEPRHWLIVKEQSGGGQMMDVGCHRIEVLHNLFGDAISINSSATNNYFERNVEDTSSAIFQFENNITATLTVTNASYEPQDTLDIFGTKGSIHVPVLNKGTMTIKTKEGERIESYPNADNFHEPLIKEFSQAVLQNSEFPVTGEIGRTVNKMIENIYTQNGRF